MGRSNKLVNMHEEKGFTLVELLVVIAIVGLLAMLAVIGLSSAREKARDAKRLTDINRIQTALELHYQEANAYPALVEEGGSIGYEGQAFLRVVPSNPLPGGIPYAYSSEAPHKTYSLQYELERGTGEISAGAHTATPHGIAVP